MLEVALTQVEASKPTKHQEVALHWTFVEAIQRADLFDLLGINTAAAAIVEGTATAGLANAVAPFHLQHHLLDWAARHKLDHRKSKRDHTNKCRNQQ